MKKIILSICALILVFVSSCSHNAVDAIVEVNGNMNLPFPITLAEEELVYDDEYMRVQGFGGYALTKEGLWLQVSGWPDVIDGYHVTEYRLTGNEYNVFGISIADTLDNAAPVLENRGYARDKKEESMYGERHYIFKKKNQVKIMLLTDEAGNIYELRVTAIATNKQNVVF